MMKKDFNDSLSSYLADVVHDIQNYTITIALGKESLQSLCSKHVEDEEDKKNTANFLRIIENSNDKIDDSSYFINAVRVFFSGKINLYDETQNVVSLGKELAEKLTHKYSQMQYDIRFSADEMDCEEIIADKDGIKYIMTILIKILKIEHPDQPIMMKLSKDKQKFQIEIFVEKEERNYVKGSFSNDPADFQENSSDETAFLKFIHFFALQVIAVHYKGDFSLSGKENRYNGFKIRFNL